MIYISSRQRGLVDLHGWAGGSSQSESNLLAFCRVEVYLPPAVQRLEEVKLVLEELGGLVGIYVESKDTCIH